MHRKKFNKYINSKEYKLIEYDPIYTALIDLLIRYLPSDIFLEAEELLNAEVLFKLEAGFQNGHKSK